MLNGILIQNFKSFHDEAIWTPLRPVTLLLGKNSSGKSALIQSMLVCAQSWRNRVFNMYRLKLVGKLADAGTFRNVYHRDSENNANIDVDPMSALIRFGFHVKTGDERWGQVVLSYGPTDSTLESTFGVLRSVKLGTAASGTPGSTHKLKTSIMLRAFLEDNVSDFWGLELRIKLSRLQKKVLAIRTMATSGSSDLETGRDQNLETLEREIVSRFMSRILSTRPDLDQGAQGDDLERSQQPESAPGQTSDKAVSYLGQDASLDPTLSFRFLFDRREGLTLVREGELVGRANLGTVQLTGEEDGSYGRRQAATANALTELERELSADPRITDALRRLESHLNMVLSKVTGELDRISYIGPLRHRGRRVYPIHTDDAIRKAGPSGEHMPDLLYHDPRVIETSNELMDRAVGLRYRIELERDLSATSAACEITLVDPSSPHSGRVGLPDVGTGVAQVLPIIVQAAKFQSRTGDSQSMLVEQPELHLHPALQSRLALLFWEVAAAGHQMIVETHSEHLVLAFGNLIAGAQVVGLDVDIQRWRRDPTARDILILALNRRSLQLGAEPSATHVERIEFADDGEFTSRFPEGFFVERMELLNARWMPKDA